MMTIQQALTWATKKLRIKKLNTASLDVEVLLSFVIKKPKEFLYTHPEKKLTAQQLKKFKALISRRLKGEPVAYLTGHQEFYGLDFYVDKRVLIPRPETELLIEEVVKKIQKYKNTPRPGSGQAKTKLAIADVGTGSGAIIISLAKILPTTYNLPARLAYGEAVAGGPPTTYYATDISKAALQVARKNARTHKVKIKFFQGDLLAPLKNQKTDIIVANLPYLIRALSYEPKKAFLAGKDGLNLYRKLFKQVADFKLKPTRPPASPVAKPLRAGNATHNVAGGPKYIIIEIDPRQTTKIKRLVNRYFPQSKLKIKKDLAGLNRMLIVKL